MGKRYLVVTFIIGALIAVLAGCDNDPEQMRSVVVVSSLNSNSPLLSDVLDQGDPVDPSDDSIAEDWIPVTFFNRPYNRIVITGPDDPHGQFLITRYTVRWVRTDGGTTTLPNFGADLAIMVPTKEEVLGQIQLVTLENKLTNLLQDLSYVGANYGDEIFMTAYITFYGHEVGTGREQTIETQLGVAFTDIEASN